MKHCALCFATTLGLGILALPFIPLLCLYALGTAVRDLLGLTQRLRM